MSEYIKTREKICFENLSQDNMSEQWVSLSWLKEQIDIFIKEHTVTKPAGKLIRILPYEWDDFMESLLEEKK